MTPRKLTAVLAGTALAMTGGAMAGCSSTTGAASGDRTLTIALPAPPESLNPGQNGSGGQGILHWLTYEPLIRANSDGTFSPALATSWKYVGKRNTRFDMTIRSGVKFADGSAVTAEAVAATIGHYLKTPGSMSPFLTGVTGAKVTGGSTVQVDLSSPNPILPYVFSQLVNWGDVISPAGLKNPAQLTTRTFGAGAYTLDTSATVAGDHYTLTKNPNYYRPDAQRWDRVVIKVIGDPNSALQALNSGQIDVDLNASATLAPQARGRNVKVLSGDPGVLALYLIDRAGKTTPALGDRRVRQALNYAIDRNAIAKALGAGYTPSAQIAPADTDGYDPALKNAYTYDPAKAKKMLADAGYPNGIDAKLVDLSLFGMNVVSQAVVAQLAKVGVRVSLNNVGNDLNKFVAELTSHKYAVTTFRLATPMFANALFNFTGATSPLNPFQSRSAEISKVFARLASAPAAGQQDAARALNKTVLDEAWFVPIATIENYLFANGVNGLGRYGLNGALDVLSWNPGTSG
ncbi:ABC transporter substrate-binding protein [Actinomadura macra]|uniref:ABC transporter substrate-binding protein n=1 Tax=Actinomadura macra TaxID=46164 RepID=UPI00082BE851|nr:ABC transporter substrate-binding protein [Actinomadura macra]